MMNASASILTNDKKSEDQLKYTSLCFGKNENFSSNILIYWFFWKISQKMFTVKIVPSILLRKTHQQQKTYLDL